MSVVDTKDNQEIDYFLCFSQLEIVNQNFSLQHKELLIFYMLAYSFKLTDADFHCKRLYHVNVNMPNFILYCNNVLCVI